MSATTILTPSLDRTSYAAVRRLAVALLIVALAIAAFAIGRGTADTDRPAVRGSVSPAPALVSAPSESPDCHLGRAC